MDLKEMNHWWEIKQIKKELVPETKRRLFEILKKDLKRRQIQIVIGLRRTGKSVLLYQLIDYLIKQNTDPLKILYCNFDEPELRKLRIHEILKTYSELTKVDYKKERIFFFIDEAQKSENWVSDIKLIYDHFPKIKIIVSGSASLKLLADAKRTLAGRAFYYELKPLSFKEYLSLKGIKIDEKRYLLYEDKLKKEFNNFIYRPFPELVKEKSFAHIKRYIRESVIEPIILKDIPKEFTDVDLLLIERLIEIFLSEPGQYLVIDELAKELHRAKKTIYQTLFYLEFSYLIKKVLNYRPKIRIASRKLPRIWPYHPALTIPFNIQPERYAENLVISELNAKYYWRQDGKEIDVLKDLTPIEVKFKSKIKKDDIRTLLYFMKKFKVRKGVLITKDFKGKIDNISCIPLWEFCFKQQI